MPIKDEIERRFLLRRFPSIPNDIKQTRYDITQGYVTEKDRAIIPWWNGSNNTRIVRYRIQTELGAKKTDYFKTQKVYKALGVSGENEKLISPLEIPLNKFERIIYKNRTKVVDPLNNNLVWEIDNFINIKLMIAEIELPNIDFRFDIPSWIKDDIIMEITGMKEFSNYNLSVVSEHK